ncbi:hypothetical protein Mterra_02522 [Calidithermus terrae]|uniref:Uncharacterized protein n=1 Tax=Calidithermus terrae TaxID=1408545 RepID=A0A399EGA5_9DEIN|nr:hypothetical protein Mterra_02522 [Calidithermus terrae]
MLAVEPWPTPVSAITAATPMITPSAVSAERKGLARMARQAIATTCKGFMPARLERRWGLSLGSSRVGFIRTPLKCEPALSV